MKLENVYIKNFRSVGESGLSLNFSSTSTIFVGENNVGKSSILKGIKKALDSTAAWEPEDWFKGDQSKTIKIVLSFIVDDKQVDEISKLLDLSTFSVDDVKMNFGDKLEVIVEKSATRFLTYIKYSDLRIGVGSLGWFGDIDTTKGYTGFNWHDCIVGANPLLPKNLFKIIKQVWDSQYKVHMDSARIQFRLDVYSQVLQNLNARTLLIDEFREKPTKDITEFQASATGRELSSILFNLKNDRPPQKQKFIRITAVFKELFPTLDLDVVKDRQKAEIFIHIYKSSTKIESTTAYVGAGILEALLLLTHFIAHEDKILLIDHPELHLHPHAQRRICALLNTASSQTITITHTPYFVNFNRNSNIIRISQIDGETRVIVPEKQLFSDKDCLRLEQFLDADVKELFFSRKVILVEGATELGALPIFASNAGYDFDGNNVSVIQVGGKNTLPIFAKLCSGFEIPFFILADSDAQNIVEKLKSQYPNAKYKVLDGTFDELLPVKLVEEARQEVGNSKPRIGKYVASKMTGGMMIPKEILQIIEDVKNF